MKRILIVCALGSWLPSCHEKPGGANLEPSFSVDTVQIKRMDSITAARRRIDSNLLRLANNSPGINAGAGKFTIGIPPGWRHTDTVLGNIRAVMFDTASGRNGFRTNISIVSDSMRGLSPDNYLAGTINGLAAYVPQFLLIGKGIRPIAGRSAHWIHYAQQSDGTDLENICYIVNDNGIAYIVTCSALKGRLRQNYPAFEHTIGSLTIR
ncbi:MAG TPA: hypothetical protein VMH27_21305 [Puia sp.]|nr:hypothetical protein [Puia sp.]